MGGSTALILARKGASVTLFDALSKPFSAASRWNEGKIHLGFLYNADASMQTAEKIVTGGLLFKPLVEDLIGCSLDPVVTSTDDAYLCHRESVVMPDDMHDYFRRISAMIRRHPDASRYLVDVTGCRAERLGARELGEITDSPDILAGFRIPERSVSTTWVADRFVDALCAENRIDMQMDTRIMAVRSDDGARGGGSWHLESESGTYGPFDYVVNALWEGRLAIDRTAGLPLPVTWTNRYRRSVFLRTSRPFALQSAIVSTGPFGDIKNYNNRDFYLSWYPAGLAAENTDQLSPTITKQDPHRERAVCSVVFAQLENILPAVAPLRTHAEKMRLEGGWVFALGKGAISDPDSDLHKRTKFGIVRRGTYISVDTGKYSTAPWLAHKIARMIDPHGR